MFNTIEALELHQTIVDPKRAIKPSVIARATKHRSKCYQICS